MRVFVTTLERFVDRRARMETILESMCVPFEFFEGPDSRKLGKAEIDSEYDDAKVRRNINRPMSISEIACTMGHRALYRKMVDEGIEKACILEDDVLLDGDFPQTLASLDSLRFENTVVKLDNYQEKQTPCSIWGRRSVGDRGQYRKPVTTQWMPWGYVIDKAAARTILETWPKIEFVCDDWRRMSSAVDIRCVQPAVVHKDDAVESIIAGDRDGILAEMTDKGGGLYLIKRLVHVVKTAFQMMMP